MLGLPKSMLTVLVVAVCELDSNALERTHGIDSGMIAFRAESGSFEFVVAD